MKIRKTRYEDLPELEKIYADARKFMAEHGNPYQWGDTRPERKVILQDIETGSSYICEYHGETAVVFTLKDGPDLSYSVIDEGKWLNEDPYGVIHRIASTHKVTGAAAYCIRYALEKYGNIRIDTHKENHIMQKLLENLEFTYCGIIYVEDGSSRMAYQKSIPR